MKKIVTLLLAVLMLASVMTFGIHAAGEPLQFGGVKIGTPVVDGKLDDIYKESIYFYIGQRDKEEYCPMENTTGVANKTILEPGAVYGYALWDDDYLYLYARANESTIVADDAIGFFFLYEQFCYAIMASPDGEVAFADGHDYDMYMSQGIVNENKEEGYWEVEIALALLTLEADPEYPMGFHLCYHDSEELDALGYETYTSGVFFDDNFYLSDVPAVATAAPETTPAPSGDNDGEEGGCGSVMMPSAVILLGLATVPAFLARKKK